VSDPSTQYKLFLLDQLSKSGVGRAASSAAGALFDFVAPVLNQIDRPQNALQGAAAEGMEGLKKGWSQEQDYRFAEALPEDFRQQYPYISETVGGVADIVVDPTIAFEWAGQAGINALLDTLNPAARALYGETGINKSSQRRVKNLVEKGSNRDTQKAVAQAIYNSYIPLQTRRVGPLAPELQEISNYSNVQNSRKMSLDAFKEGADKTSFSLVGEGKKTRQAKTPEKDIEFAYEFLRSAFKRCCKKEPY
jgi:hypothetical protein